MNLEEYNRRKESMHSVTGIPTYWEELQAMTADRDRWRKAAEALFYAGDQDSVRHAAELVRKAEQETIQ